MPKVSNSLANLRASNEKTALAQGSGPRAGGLRPEPTAQNPQPERPEVFLIGALSRKRAVITGVGVISPNGIGKMEFWKGLKEGRNCVDKISSFDPTSFPCKVASEIKNFFPADFILDKTEIKRMGRSAHLGVAAAVQAVKDCGLNLESTQVNGTGVIIGSATSGLEYAEPDFRSLETGGVRRVRPYLGIAGFGGAVSSEISRALKIRGPSLTISTGCTASTDAMGFALESIRSGKLVIAITGGADACVTPGILAAFCQMGAVTIRTNSDIKKASRPFNKDRDGFVLGEGAWIFVLEEMQHALQRHANIYAEIVGYAATCDAGHMAKPDPSGEYTAEALKLAIKDAGLSPRDIDLYSAYGNGTPINDSYETAVVKKVFGERAYEIPVVSIKSMLGHPLGASGAQELAGVLLAIQESYIHPTINYEVPDPECDLDYVPNQGRQQKVKTAICNSIAFGAKNAAIVVKTLGG